MIDSLIFSILTLIIAVSSIFIFPNESGLLISGISIFLCGGFTTFYILERQNRIKQL